MKASVKVIVLLALVCTVVVGSAWADPVNVNPVDDVLESVPGGVINWTARRIEARGTAEKDQSAFQQQLTAEVQARANLLKVLDGVRVKAERITRDGRIKGEMISEEIEGILRHSRVTPPAVNELGLTEVIAYAYLDSQGQPMLVPGVRRSDAAQRPVAVSPASVQAEDWTGLIIDAGNLPLRPALVPRFIKEGGSSVINDRITMSHTDIIRQGYCGYTGTEKSARLNADRIGKNPLVIKATGVSSNGTDLFVSAEDAAKISELNARKGLLRSGRIIIVTGGDRG